MSFDKVVSLSLKLLLLYASINMLGLHVYNAVIYFLIAG